MLLGSRLSDKKGEPRVAEVRMAALIVLTALTALTALTVTTSM